MILNNNKSLRRKKDISFSTGIGLKKWNKRVGKDKEEILITKRQVFSTILELTCLRTKKKKPIGKAKGKIIKSIQLANNEAKNLHTKRKTCLDPVSDHFPDHWHHAFSYPHTSLNAIRSIPQQRTNQAKRKTQNAIRNKHIHSTTVHTPRKKKHDPKKIDEHSEKWRDESFPKNTII